MIRREVANTGWCAFCCAWHVLYAGTGLIPVHRRPMPTQPPDSGQVLLAASTFDVQHICPGSDLLPKETKIQHMMMLYSPEGVQHYTPLFEGFVNDELWGFSGEHAPGYFPSAEQSAKMWDTIIDATHAIDDDIPASDPFDGDNDDWEDLNNVELDD